MKLKSHFPKGVTVESEIHRVMDRLAAGRVAYPPGYTVESEIHRVMDRLAAGGVAYPPGYDAELISKCKKEGVPYPWILRQMGEPRIRKHARYQDILQQQASLLDCGCGTGDDIRALVADGYPARQIVGYDVNWNSINLGYDLYLDRETLGIQFVVDREFPFSPSSFDLIYSGSVLHVLATKRAIRKYVSSAFATLAAGGTFFGTTLGFRKGMPKQDPKEQIPLGWRLRRRWYWLRWLAGRVTFLSQEWLQRVFEESGFTDIEISFDDLYCRLWFSAKKS